MTRDELNTIADEILGLWGIWGHRLEKLDERVISERRNRQQRNIRQITGHLADSASNNIHRIVHLQYQASPLVFPDYAHHGSNDRWIAIQDYDEESWSELVEYCLASWRHLAHLLRSVDLGKGGNSWIDALGEKISLDAMIKGLLPHLKLHFSEIAALTDQLTMDLDS